MAHHRIVELEAVLEFLERGAIDLDVEADVVRLGDLVDRIGQLPPTPILDAMDLSGLAGHQSLVTREHRRNLLALIGMDDQYDLVMTHELSLWTLMAARDACAVRQGIKVKPAMIAGSSSRGQATADESVV